MPEENLQASEGFIGDTESREPGGREQVGSKPKTGASPTIVNIIREIVKTHAGESQASLLSKLTESEFELVKLMRAMEVLREDLKSERDGSRAKDTTIGELTERLARMTDKAQRQEAEILRLSELIESAGRRGTAQAVSSGQAERGGVNGLGIDTPAQLGARGAESAGNADANLEKLKSLQEEITLLQRQLQTSEDAYAIQREQMKLLEEKLARDRDMYEAQIKNLKKIISEFEHRIQNSREIEKKLRTRLLESVGSGEPDGKSPNLFGKMAVRLKHCEQRHVEEALEVQKEITDMGLQPPRIGDILVDRGHITPEQVEEISREQSRSRPRLEGYGFVRKLGEGLLGSTYQAKQLSLDRDVVVRILRHEFTGDADYISSFLDRSRRAGKLHHKNVARVIDAGERDGIYYYITEFIRGKNLRQVLRKKRFLTERQVLHIGLEIAEALQEAHSYDLVHGDIRPTNIIVSVEGVAKLCNYGLSMRIDLSTDFKLPGEFYDCVYYASPEQINGLDVDIRSDIYSLGATLFVLATGTFPFGKGPSPKDSMLAHLTEFIPDLTKRNPKVSLEAAAIVMKMLEPAPENRYQSPLEVISAVKGLLKRKPPS